MAGRGKDFRRDIREKLRNKLESQDSGNSSPSPDINISSDSEVGIRGNTSSTSSFPLPLKQASGHSSLICGALRPHESITLVEPFSSSSEEVRVSGSCSSDDDLVTQIRKLNAGFHLGRGRGRGRVIAISSDESEEDFRARQLNLSRPVSSFSNSTELPSTSPSFSSSTSDAGSEANNGETIIRKGINGRRVPLAANYIWLTVENNKGVYQYHVNFDPPMENLRTKKFLLKEHVGLLGTIRNFDGAKLFLPFKLPDKITELESLNPNDPTMRVKLNIKYIDPRKNGSHMRDYIQFCNILFRRIMTVLGLVNVNREFFNIQMDAIHRLPQHKLEIWPGYVTAIDEREGGLMLCCDVSFRVLRTATMLDIWRDTEYLSHCNSRIDAREEYKNYVLGKVILTRYNNRHYRIDDVTWEKNPLSEFEYRGKMITFVSYYQIQYSISITDMDQPLLCHLPRPKKNDPRQVPQGPVLLVPELCYMTGLTEEITSKHAIMKDISRHTRVTPEQRNQCLQKFINNVNKNENAIKILSDWGLKLEDGVAEFEGRIIGEDLVLQLNPNFEFVLKSKNYDFGSETRRNPCYEPVAVSNWVVFCRHQERGLADTMSKKYLDVCRSIGINARPGRIQLIPGQRLDNYRSCISEVLKNCPDLQFVVVLMSRRQDDLYSMIKKLCCVDKPIPSQIILCKTLNDARKLNSVMSKIALQINCKLGGGLWTIRMPRVEKIMFVGVDVWHDPKQKQPSVTALVASINEYHTKYFSKVSHQPAHQETMSSLRSLFTEALKEFYVANNGRHPDRVLFFRDGIGDGELKTTKQFEVVQLTESLSSQCNNSPKFTFTVVQKRIHSRIFIRDSRSGKYINPTPGTVLDHTITRKSYFDFFLVSQLIHEGTVTPTHYVVLEDNSNITPDLIQKFAFATSFMYYNWAGSIRVPAVCQYAHKLAFLVGQHLGMDPSEKLSKQLFYL